MSDNLPFSFTHAPFLLLLGALPALYLIARRRGAVRRGPWPLVLWLRVATAVLLVLALAGLRLPAAARSVATVFVVDLSASVPADVREGAKGWVRQALAQAHPDDLAAIVTFGADARVELPLGKARDHATWGEPPLTDGTNIAAALDLAASLLPAPGAGSLRRFVLLSDGNETSSNARAVTLRPHFQDVEVAVLVLPQRLNDVGITGFSVPPVMREGEPAELRLALLSPAAVEGVLRIWAKGGTIEQLVYEQTLQLPSGGPHEVSVNAGTLSRGSWALQAVLDVPGDSQPQNNESWAVTVVQDPARVLLVEGQPGEATALRDTLLEVNIQVDVVRPAQLPAQAQQLARYESVILANVHAADLRREQMQAVQRYVSEQGRGLVVVGGERTFGLGEYTNSPLEEALPVTVQPPDREQSASLALILVIDRSGSMSGTDTGDRRTTRMELAKEGAIQAVETLQDGDQVGVIAFDYTPRWITEVRTIRGPGDVRAVADRIATIQPDGGTDIYSAMDAAYRGLQQVTARIKHVILLTDGEQGSPAPFVALINAMRRAGITLSTVGVSGDIGSRAQADMQDWARRGQGRYYFTNTARDVPRIMTQEARLAGRSFKQERDFKPRLVTAAPAVRGLVPADFPPLHGYVRVSPKRGAETVLSSDQEEVVLAEWQYGLGRSLVWTADAQGEWSKDWVPTEQYRRLWPQAVRWTMPAPAVPGLQVAVGGDGREGSIRVEAYEAGGFRNGLQTVADVAAPDGSATRLPLLQSAPGRYEGTFGIGSPGAYFVHVTQTDPVSGEVVATQTTGYALPHLPEYSLAPANRVMLERLAAETGGPSLAQPPSAWRRDTRGALPHQPVWDWLLMGALTLFVADVAARRLRLSRRDLQALRPRWRGLGRLRPGRRWPAPKRREARPDLRGPHPGRAPGPPEARHEPPGRSSAAGDPGRGEAETPVASVQ